MGVRELRIRPAQAEDAEALAGLIHQLGYAVSPLQAVERLTAIGQQGHLVLVAELAGDVVGCVSTSTMHVLHRPAPVGRISMMVVDEALRGQGIGARLVNAVEQALAESGCYMVEVSSNLRRTAAHAFYERLGYERTSYRFARELPTT